MLMVRLIDACETLRSKHVATDLPAIQTLLRGRLSAVCGPAASVPGRDFAVDIPADGYVVFDVPDLEDLAQTFAVIEEWLPLSRYQACHGYAFEKITFNPEIRAEIWLPVSIKADAT